MADEFDPYYTWLGIRPEEQPPDHYRLIAVRQFEDNADVISNAMDQRMQYLRSMQVGKRSALSQKLLNEISAAGGCLLDPKRKQAYDQELKLKGAKAAPARPPISNSPPPAAGASAPVVPAPVAPATPLFDVNSPGKQKRTTGGGTGSTISQGKKTSGNRAFVLGGAVVGVIALTAVVIAAAVTFLPGGDDIADNPEGKGKAPGVVEDLPDVPSTVPSTEPPKKPPAKVPEKSPVNSVKPAVPAVPPATEPPATAVAPWWQEVSQIERLLALEINQDSYVEFPDSAGKAALNKALTAELWMRLQLVGEKPVQILGTRVMEEGKVPKGWGLLVQKAKPGESTKDQLIVEFFKTTGEYVRYPLGLPKTDDWHHLALTWEPGKGGRLFVDGRLQMIGGKPLVISAEKDLSPSDRNLMLGCNPQPPGADFKAEFCGVRIATGVRYFESFTPAPPLEIKPDSATFAMLDGRLLEETPIASGTGSGRYPWQYGVGLVDEEKNRVADFALLEYATSRQWQGGEKLPAAGLGWLTLDPLGGAAGQDVNHAAIRRWTAPQTGVLSIAGRLRHSHEVRDGDGVRGRIISSRTGPLGEWRLLFTAEETTVDKVAVQAGDTIDFVVDPQEDFQSDAFEWIVDLRLEDKGKKVLGVWNSAVDFRVKNILGAASSGSTPSPAAGPRPPHHTLTHWLPLGSHPACQAWTEVNAAAAESALPGKQVPLPPSPLAVTPKPPRNPAAEPRIIKKTPIPTAAELTAAQVEVTALFADERKAAKTPKARLELAKRILGVVKDTSVKPLRYSLLQEVRQLALEAKDVSVAMNALETLGAEFEMDLLAQQVGLLEGLAAESLTLAQRSELLSETCDLGYEALDQDQFAAAQSLVALIRSTAAKSATAEAKLEAKEFLAWADGRLKRMDAIEQAEATLATTPDDPMANLTLGLHLCFNRGDQKKGLPMLAKGIDQKLAVAAQIRLENITKGVVSSLEEADAWFDVIATVPPEYKADVQKLALEGYEFLANSLAGVDKLKAEKRAGQLSADVAAAPAKRPPKRLRGRDLPETSPGMIGRVLIDGKDAGWLLTHQPPKEMNRDQLVSIITQAKATGGRIVLEGILNCPTPMSIKIDHIGRMGGPQQLVSVNGKPVNPTGGEGTKSKRNNSVSLQLPAGNHLVQWVVDFDGSNTPQLRIIDDGGAGGRNLSLYYTREQHFEARKRPTKEEMSLSK